MICTPVIKAFASGVGGIVPSGNGLAGVGVMDFPAFFTWAVSLASGMNRLLSPRLGAS